ncbi:MAG TPA: undecaprenyl/decaprenyl-phosphate alpha-N-acetylglucosaminyl 1-phosphate transferase [Acidimicrobiales bacterium]|nr:undecaprenyl/decaprenyl-phosphate alpha-N-acetylglucosaminyl 1-phosphate transferase [Acidimicrobiales bacterium]
MIHFREYIVVFGVSAVVTWLATFPVRGIARRHALIVVPDPRRVHERPTPTGGGAAMFLGLLAAVAVASQLPAFAPVFRGNSAPMGIVLGATVIFAVGMADDLREMSPPAKLAGQILAGTVLYVFGVNMIYFHVPLAETTLVLGNDWAPLATVLWVAVMANSVNFIDGLDGLAAGVVAIGAGAFFVYSHQLGVVGNITENNSGPLIAVITVGLCVGFLPHNFYPAKIFMGDAGAMLLGVLVAASTLAVVGQDSYQFSGRTYFFFAPIIIPFFILGIPLLDTLFAIVRRAGKRTSPAVADLNHLHHRLMRLGHGHRQAVVILWAWTALLSGFVLWPGVTNSHNEIPPIAVAALSILLYTLFAPRGRASTGPENGQAPAKRSLRGRADMAMVSSPSVANALPRRAMGPGAPTPDRGMPVSAPAGLGRGSSAVRLLSPVAQASSTKASRAVGSVAPGVGHPAPPVTRPGSRAAPQPSGEVTPQPAVPAPGGPVPPRQSS